MRCFAEFVGPMRGRLNMQLATKVANFAVLSAVGPQGPDAVSATVSCFKSRQGSAPHMHDLEQRTRWCGFFRAPDLGIGKSSHRRGFFDRQRMRWTNSPKTDSVLKNIGNQSRSDGSCRA